MEASGDDSWKVLANPKYYTGTTMNVGGTDSNSGPPIQDETPPSDQTPGPDIPGLPGPANIPFSWPIPPETDETTATLYHLALKYAQPITREQYIANIKFGLELGLGNGLGRIEGAIIERTLRGISSQLIKQVAVKYPLKAGITEWHHIIPKYLTKNIGVIKTMVQIPAAYHQVITNEIRKTLPYGQQPPKKAELEVKLNKVYNKYPINGFPIK